MRTRHWTPVVPVAAALALVLGACGTDDTVETSEPTTGAPADGRRAPEPIELAAGTGLGGSASEATSDAAAVEDARWYVVADYVVADDLPALPDDDTGWVYEGGSVTEARVREIAEVFGVAGDPIAVEQDLGGGWRIGPDDGSAPTLWVSADAQQSWNYSPAWDDASLGRVGCATAAVPEPDPAIDDADVEESAEEPVEEPVECEEPEPPAGVPSADDAERLARDLMVQLGEDPAAFDVETYADEWFASVDLRDDRGRWANFGFGGDALLQYAGGTLAIPEAVGPYPLIGLDDAAARLDDGGWFGGGIAVDPPMAEPAIAESAASDVAVAPQAGGAAPEPDPDGSVATLPVEDLPAPEPITVTLVDVEADLWWAWDVDGTLWLLPAYRFVDTDGGWHVVPAVTDEYLIRTELPEPMPVEPVEPVEPASAGAELRPDLVVVTPDLAEPGTEIEVTFAEPYDRGVAWTITTGDGATELYWLTASAEGYGGAPSWVPAGTDGWGVDDIGISGTGPDRLVVPDTIAAGEYHLCTANAVVDVCGLLVVFDPGELVVTTEPPKQTPTESIPPIAEPVPLQGVYEGVEFYPACGDERLVHEGVTWYQVHEADYPEVWAAVVAAVREEPPAADAVRGLVRVAPPGPGDDVGTLVVWFDGVARWVSDSGTLSTWMVDDELSYDWVC